GERVGSIPVDVRGATAHHRLRAHDPAAAALAQAYGRPENREPSWPFEREMPSGKLLEDPHSTTQQTLVAHRARQPVANRALAAHAQKTQIPYQPAAGVPLNTVTTTTTITAHVSPDAGLATLQNFLGGTKRSLVIGMYDFTSGTILKTFLSDLTGNKSLQMVLDNPAPNPTRDQTDTQTVDELDRQLGGRAKITRALVRSDLFAAEWMFPYAYHVKLIVRDGTSFWLSSGNLNNSNQPDLALPPQYEDRDWHVIIEDAGLSKTFATYLNQDFASASQHQTTSRAQQGIRRRFPKAGGQQSEFFCSGYRTESRCWGDYREHRNRSIFREDLPRGLDHQSYSICCGGIETGSSYEESSEAHTRRLVERFA